MKNKKLLVLIVIVAAIAVVAVVFAAVFTVNSAMLVFHNEEGAETAAPSDAPSADEVIKNYKGKSIIFMSKEGFLADVNERFPEWHAVAAVKSFPNRIDVHFVRRTAVFSLNTGAETLYLDSFGYVMATAPDTAVIDVTDAFSGNFANLVKEPGTRLTFAGGADNRKLDCIVNSVSAVWRLKYSFNDIPQLIGGFSFGDGLEYMSITTQAGAVIKVAKPETNLEGRLIKAFSVYQNGGVDLQKPGVEINVSEKGDIITPKN